MAVFGNDKGRHAPKKAVNKNGDNWDLSTMFGPDVSFAVSEAYKLLRTNIMFSFSAEQNCHILGVTSSIRGEGKSTTACNLCYALCEAGKKALLLEADLRLPSLSAKLNLQRSPGITNLLVERRSYLEAIQHCSAAPGMDILTAGDSAPNPSELLGSPRMAELINQLSRAYDYIVIDLPPVTAVSDALVMSKLLHGIVMVVRSGIVEQRVLAEAMRQLKLVNVRILGFVYRGSDDSGSGYSRKYGKRYGKNYSRYYADYDSKSK